MGIPSWNPSFSSVFRVICLSMVLKVQVRGWRPPLRGMLRRVHWDVDPNVDQQEA